MRIFGGTKQQGGVATMEPETGKTEVPMTLEQAQAQMDTLAADRARLQAWATRMEARIVAIDAESNALKPQLLAADGNAAANAVLDSLDSERIQAIRKLDGIKLAIAGVEQKLSPLQGRARELAQAADAERQDQAVAKFQETAQRLAGQIIDGWVKACRDAHELVVTVEDAIHSGNLDDDHRSRVLAANETLNNLFLQAGLRPVNEAWVRRESHLFRRMQIVAARPK